MDKIYKYRCLTIDLTDLLHLTHHCYKTEVRFVFNDLVKLMVEYNDRNEMNEELKKIRQLWKKNTV